MNRPAPEPDRSEAPSTSFAPRVIQAGDSALVVELGPPSSTAIDAAANRRVIALAAAVRVAAPLGVRDVVSAFSACAVHFDPVRTDVDRLRALVEQLAVAPPPADEPASEPTRLPVCYGGEWGPDLDRVATVTGLSPSAVVDLHARVVYRVFMVGFSPGFPYLGILDRRLHVPRLPTPRTRVVAGSVGLAGAQTGIYPNDTPGGWNLIGRTPVPLFDQTRSDPSLLKPGGRVRFYPISPAEFAVLKHSAPWPEGR